MEFLKNYKRRSIVSEITYILLNIGLSIALMLLVEVTGLIWPSLILVILSFWRIFAVRPQFWFANIQANLVSFIIGASFVILLFVVKSTNLFQEYNWIVNLFFAGLYSIWLLVLKPLSKRKYIAMQAALSLFLGITSICMIAYGINVIFSVMLFWIVGYSSARHILSSYDEEDRVVFLSLAWAFVIAELGWMSYHWMIAYRLPIFSSILIPQVSFMALSISFLVYKIYNSFYHNQKIKMNDILLPLIFVIAIILVLIIGFNGVANIAI